MRDLANPLLCDQYTEHSYTPTVARYSPSRSYIASGDSSGKVRVWDCIGDDRICKLEVDAVFGPVADISWCPDSRRICAIGDGKGKFGRVFFFDTGASVGEIGGASKRLTSCHMKPNRPFRLITGSEDGSIQWFEGPPFKWRKNISNHRGFVNCVRFDPTGSLFASSGQDMEIILFDGKTGDCKSSLPKEHKMGVYSFCWNHDGTQILSSSGDRSCKIWDVEANKCISTFSFPKDTGHMQLGCLWQGDFLVSLGLNGHLTYLDKSNPDTPLRVIKGHNKYITSFAFDKSNNNVYTGSYDSLVVRWNVDTGDNDLVSGVGHTNQVSGLAIQNKNLISCGYDDTIRITPLGGEKGDPASIDSPAQGIASGTGDTIVVVTLNQVNLFHGTKKKISMEVNWSPKCVSVNPASNIAAIGGGDHKIYLFSIEGDSLKELRCLERHTRQVTSITFSPDGKYLASGDQKNEIIVWDTSNWSIIEEGWCFHTASVQTLGWSPTSRRLASGSIDQCVFVWNLDDRGKRIRIRGAHRGGVTNVQWLDDKTVASSGMDCVWKTWTI